MEQDFVLTAYYSPLPDQCCYVKGSLEADRILNGNGTHGADGTPVYPGMLAAPSSYAFGTRVALPGIGTLTVHDRGGAIVEQENAHRLDVWMGSGEEGLARALEFGVRRVRGTVYAPGADRPDEKFHLDAFAAPFSRLAQYEVTEEGDIAAAFGARGLSVVTLQSALTQLGYFSAPATGFFGEVTKSGLEAFLRDMRLDGETADRVTPRTAAMLEAATMIAGRTAPVGETGPDSSAADLAKARRLLRSLGYYRGRTLGAYDDKTKDAIMAFQRDHRLIGDAASPGAGRIGPRTLERLSALWRAHRAKALAQKILLRQEIAAKLEEKGVIFSAFLRDGAQGDAVRSLQTLLADRGFFPANRVNGNYGELTRGAVLGYQLARGIVASAADTGAGGVGPATLKSLREEAVDAAAAKARAYGTDAVL